MSCLEAPSHSGPSCDPGSTAQDAGPQDEGLDEFLRDLQRLAAPPSQLFLDYFGPGAARSPPDQA